MKKLLVLIFSLTQLSTLAYRYAVTKSRQTIVYADVNLSAPIGYIRSGRKIKVGDNDLKQGTIVPLVVSGKIAYVRTNDISYSVSGTKLEHVPEITDHDVRTIFTNDAQRLKENSFISLDYARLEAGTEWDDFQAKYANETSPAFNRFNLAIEYRDPKHRHGFKITLGYLTASATYSSINSVLGELQYQFRFINRNSFVAEGFAGIILTGDFEQENFGEKATGMAYGYNIGGRIRFAPYSKIGFYGQAGLSGLYTSSMDKLVTETVSSIGGVTIGAGISFRL
ncbi:hypothetical protein ACRXCV_08765 [Halobacteriovorax sp. GFR7]|uniref:hypothetical protein n=1 Tax=unclassified Halobacteriovorax TaxID=2639665 RepID=UPI003D9809A4